MNERAKGKQRRMILTRSFARAGMLLGLLLLAVTSSIASIQVDLNGSPLSFSVQPIQINGRTMVPLRGIFEALGSQVNWDSGTRMITANKGDTEVQLTIGDTHARVNGRTVLLDTPATILQGSTMVPLRFISESLGADVKWFEATQTVSITISSDSTTAPVYIDQGNLEPSYSSGPASSDRYQTLLFTSGELDVLLGPIALYPDPLIAQILPAATFPDQLDSADYLIRQTGGTRDIDLQDWDVSVKAVAYYPSVLHVMVDKPDWTISVGQAYSEQSTDVMRSIQRLRAKSRSLGYLSSNNQQRVYIESGYIRIVPVQSRYIYVPQYDPQVVYVHRRNSSSSNAIGFGLGLVIGSWLNRDLDWQHNQVYYHGWNGGGWIGNSKSHVSTDNNHYVSNDYRNRPITVDRSVKTRDLGNYRTSIRKNVGTFKLPESRRPSQSNTRPNQNGKNNSHTNDKTKGG